MSTGPYVVFGPLAEALHRAAGPQGRPAAAAYAAKPSGADAPRPASEGESKES